MSPRILASLLLGCLLMFGMAFASDPRHWAHAAPPPAPAEASPDTVPVYTTQQTTTVASIIHTPVKSLYLRGDVLTMTVRLENIQNFFGGGVEWTFLTDTIRILDADPGRPSVQVTPGDIFPPGSFIAYPQEGHADNVRGKINFAGVYLNPTPPFSGSGNLVTMSMRVVGDCGNVVFDLTPQTLKISDPTGTPIPFISAGSFQPRIICPTNFVYLPHLSRRYPAD